MPTSSGAPTCASRFNEKGEAFSRSTKPKPSGLRLPRLPASPARPADLSRCLAYWYPSPPAGGRPSPGLGRPMMASISGPAITHADSTSLPACRGMITAVSSARRGFGHFPGRNSSISGREAPRGGARAVILRLVNLKPLLPAWAPSACGPDQRFVAMTPTESPRPA